MAKVTIVLKDKGKGLGIQVHSHPPFPDPAARGQKSTASQEAAMLVLQYLHDRLKEIEHQARLEVGADPS